MDRQNNTHNFDSNESYNLPLPTQAELVDLVKRGEISVKRFHQESDWVATQEAYELQQQRKAARREKLRRIGKTILGNN